MSKDWNINRRDGYLLPPRDQEDTMPTDLPEGFKGTRKPIRSSDLPRPDLDTPKVETEEDIPGWAKILTLLVLVIGSWALVTGLLWLLSLIF